MTHEEFYQKLVEVRKLVTKQRFYSPDNSGDKLTPGKKIWLEHDISINKEKMDISPLVDLPIQLLEKLQVNSLAEQNGVLFRLAHLLDEWDFEAANTAFLNAALEYLRMPEVEHTSNMLQSNKDSDRANKNVYYEVMSNKTYKMWAHVAKSSIQRGKQEWALTWTVQTNPPPSHYFGIFGPKIAGGEKSFDSEAALQKYWNGRIKAYAHLFTELCPPIPADYADRFHVHGQLLPGYTIEGQEQPLVGDAAPQRPSVRDQLAASKAGIESDDADTHRPASKDGPQL